MANDAFAALIRTMEDGQFIDDAGMEYPNRTEPTTPPNSNARTDIGDALDFARRTFQPELTKLTHDFEDAPQPPALLAHDSQGNAKLVSVKALIDEWRTRPERRAGTIAAHDLDSFVALVNRDKLDASVIFAEVETNPKLTAVLDFHEARADEGAEASPAFCRDRIVYAFPVSDEWATWTEHAGKDGAMSQGEFAQFIEDHIFDVGEPQAAGAIAQAFATKLGISFAGPSTLMAISRGLAVRVEETVRNVVSLQSGEVQMVFGAEHKDANGAPLNVPAAFHLMIPIFKGGPLYSIPVRLRYRAGGGRVTWFYELHRADLFMQDAVNDALARVRQQPEAHQEATGTALATTGGVFPGGGCGLPVYVASPPA